MGVVVLGRYARVRWTSSSPDAFSRLEAPNATSFSAAALLEGAEEAWGLASNQPVMLPSCMKAGSNEPNNNVIVRVPELPAISNTIGLPRVGRWLVGVEHSGSMWAWLSQAKLERNDKTVFSWTSLDVPGAGELQLGRPRCGDVAFELVTPPPFGGAYPARVGEDGILQTQPFNLENGNDDDDLPEDADQLTQFLDGICHHVTPRYRYGLLTDGVMQWLDLKPGIHMVTATRTTALLRARLSLFKRELASRGIYYEDDDNEIGYELRFAIEDGQVPESFYEPDAALAYTVSGQGLPEEDKQKQASQLFDPEGDWETGQSYAIDYPTMPARIDVNKTELLFYTSEFTRIGRARVDDAWARAHLECAGLAAGLSVGASRFPALSFADRERLDNGKGVPLINENAVDAADRVQCAAYVFATGGEPDLEVEARLSRLRGATVRVLLGRKALQASEEVNYAYATEISVTVLALAPGPFPRRAYAVIGLAEALVDVNRRTAIANEAIREVRDPIERKLALLVAARTMGRQATIVRAVAWPNDEASDAISWGVEVVEPLFGSLQPLQNHL